MNHPQKFVTSLLPILTLAWVLGTSIPAIADQTWDGGGATDDWNDPANWTTAVPSAENANINDGSTAVIDSAVPNITSFRLPLSSGSPFNFSGNISIVTGGSLTTTGSESYVGLRPSNVTSSLTVNGGSYTGTQLSVGEDRGSAGGDPGSKGSVTLSAGTISLSSNLFLGRKNSGAGSLPTGSLTVSNGTLSVTGSGTLYVGEAGVGTATFTGGTTTAASGIRLGNSSGSTGTATIGGTAQVTSTALMYVGNAGVGSLTLQDSGKLNTGVNGFVVGGSSTGNVLNLNGGTLTVGGSGLIVGFNSGGSGTVNVTAHTTTAHNVTGDVELGRTGANGNMTISGGTFGTTANGNSQILVGSAGTGTGNLTVSGGILNANSGLYVANGTGAGSMTIQGSAGQIAVKNDDFNLGFNGPATLNLQIGASGITPIDVWAGTGVGVSIAANVGSSAALNVALTAAPPTSPLVVINNATGSAVTGSLFTGLPEGALVSAIFNSTTYQWNLTYVHNSASGNTTDNIANDVALILVAIPEPSTIVMTILGMSWFLMRGRRSHKN